MKKILVLFALAASLHAAKLTTISAPPPGEGDTLAIVAEYCPECVRLSDDQDLYFREPDEHWYIFAFEDLREESIRDADWLDRSIGQFPVEAITKPLGYRPCLMSLSPARRSRSQRCREWQSRSQGLYALEGTGRS